MVLWWSFGKRRRGCGIYSQGEILKAIKKRGLTIKSFKHGQFTVNVKAKENPEEAGKVDVVLLCVKSYDTERVAPLLHKEGKR